MILKSLQRPGVFVLCVPVFVFPCAVDAFTPNTHGHMTYYGGINSILCGEAVTYVLKREDRPCEDGEVLENLGLSATDVLGDTRELAVSQNGLPKEEITAPVFYYDFIADKETKSGIHIRGTRVMHYDREVRSVLENRDFSIYMGVRAFISPELNQHFMPLGWLMRGAIREDDYEDVDGVFLNIRSGEKVYVGCYIKSDHPVDEFVGAPYGFSVVQRSVNHFYDPFNDRPLTSPFLSFPLGERNPAWALGTETPFSDVNNAVRSQTDPIGDPVPRPNHFTVKDSREAMYRALTGLSKGGVEIGIKPDRSALRRATEADRMAYWATTFRSLGNVMHLIEDSAQPQHTRNDSHSGACEVAGHDSSFEKYYGAKSAGKFVYYTVDAGARSPDKRVLDKKVNYAGYIVPVVGSYEDIWSTAPGSKDKNQAISGMGLADYSNRGFFTVGTNLGTNNYPLPSGDVEGYKQITIQANEDIDPASISDGELMYSNYYTGSVPDALTGIQAPDVRLTKEGVFYKYLTQVSAIDDTMYEDVMAAQFTMDTNIYEDRIALVAPRAVGYGAAFLNYFFRGKLEITSPDDKVYSIIDTSASHSRNMDGVTPVGAANLGFTKIRVKVRNASPIGENMKAPDGKADEGGRLRVVVKYKLNHCYSQDMKGELGEGGAIISGCDKKDYWSTLKPDESLELKDEKIAVSNPVPVSSLSRDFTEYTFDFENNDILPINAHSLKIQVVYRGWLGKEADAVVAATLDIPEPTFIYTVNNLDFQCINGTNDNKPFLSDKYKDGTLYGDTQHNADLPRLRIYLNDSEVHAAELNELKVAQYSRLAALIDGETYKKQLKYVAVDPYSGEEFVVDLTNPSSRRTHVAQKEGEKEVYTYTYKFRGIFSKGVPGLIVNGSDNCPTYGGGGTDLEGSMTTFAELPESEYLKNLSPISATINWD